MPTSARKYIIKNDFFDKLSFAIVCKALFYAVIYQKIRYSMTEFDIRKPFAVSHTRSPSVSA